jgi:hypothetical protein
MNEDDNNINMMGVEEGEELVMDKSAYEMYHQAQTGLYSFFLSISLYFKDIKKVNLLK